LDGVALVLAMVGTWDWEVTLRRLMRWLASVKNETERMVSAAMPLAWGETDWTALNLRVPICRAEMEDAEKAKLFPRAVSVTEPMLELAANCESWVGRVAEGLMTPA